MRVLTDTQVKEAEAFYIQECNSIAKNLDQDEVRKYIMYLLQRHERVLCEWINGFNLTYAAVLPKKQIIFDKKRMYLTFSQTAKLSLIRSEIRIFFDKMLEDVTSKKNIESIYPNALELLYSGKSPNSLLKIDEYYNDKNFTYLKTRVRLPGAKYGKIKEIEREMVIEQWGKYNDNYKTKNKDFAEDFIASKKYKMAPKAKEIVLKIENSMVRYYSNFEIKASIKNDGEQIFILAHREIKNNDSRIIEMVVPYVAYKDSESIWIKFRRDNFTSGDSFIVKEQFFKINEHGGLVETMNNPFEDKDIVEDEAPPLINTPEKIEDVRIMTNELETEIVSELKYDFFKVTELLRSNEAVQFKIINELYFWENIQYFALYGDTWIETTENNPKVKMMIEASEFADKLTEGWEKLETARF